MKKVLSITMLGILLLTGCACVTEKQYRDVQATAQKLQGQLDAARADLDDCQKSKGANAEVAAALSAARRRAAAAEQERSLMSAKYDALSKTHAELRDAYAKVTTTHTKIPQLGDVFVLPREVNEALVALARENAQLLEFSPKYGMVKFKSDLTFKLGSDTVQDSAIAALQKLAAIVNDPAVARFNVYVAGHTDDVRIVKADTLRRHPNNWYLSVHRAVSVQQVMEKAGVSPDRIGAIGFGEYHPVGPNKPNRGGNPANRRVEIWIVPPGRYLTQGS